jgi:uncharacterized protein (DUF433 family)
MIELTLEQVKAIAEDGNQPPTVIDPTTQTTYTLVRSDLYAQMQQGTAAPAEKETPRETPVPPWQYLVRRRHPWRKQLFIKGRNMTVRHLVGTVRASRFTEEEAAADLHLPVEAIREALAYFEANPEVIELDAASERYFRKLHGVGRGPESVHR